MMGRVSTCSLALVGLVGLTGFADVATAQCPLHSGLLKRDGQPGQADADRFLKQFEVSGSDGYLTDDAGIRHADQDSLKAGSRGSTLLEDFIFRQKITSFDHERVPERAVHARGAGAFGTFTSYGDWSNLTAASFLSQKDKVTETFVRFSTVAGSRGSADTVRDVHGFAVRFFTDAGNFDIVGNNIPVFFIQDAIRFPDLVHAVKPEPNNEIPQAATAHDNAWDFFSSQPSTLHTLLWAMSGHGIPRSYRHMNGFGVHTYRLVTADGKSKLIKWHFLTKQGLASLVWEEAQTLAGMNADAHRKDLYDAIGSGHGPEWELAVQVVDEDKALAYGFDLLDATKLIPVELAPLQKLGLLKLTRNPTNYFAETEQIMFQPGHIVPGVDFSEDPLLQGRIFSYLDTQLNRNGGPNFEQLPINRPHVKVNNNHRDGAGQQFIHTNQHPYSPNTLNDGFPKQATQTDGHGFFTAPGRGVTGKLARAQSATFDDHWTQPRLFYNSLAKVEQQWVINAIRFETSHLKSDTVKKNVLIQLNKVSHEIAQRVASALGLEAPAPDPKYYHDKKTAGMSIVSQKLPTIATLQVAILATTQALEDAVKLRDRLKKDGLVVSIVAESLTANVDRTYSTVDAVNFDAMVVTAAADSKAGLFGLKASSSLYPAGRPTQVVANAYLFGKPVAYFGSGNRSAALTAVGLTDDGAPGVYTGADLEKLVTGLEDGLATFKFVNRFATDS